MTRKTLLLSLPAGILLLLSFPKFGQGIVAWIALVPLFFALREKTSSQALQIGFLSGLTAEIGIIYWVALVIVNYGRLPFYAGLGAMLLLAAYLAFYFALFAAGTVYFTGKGIPLMVSAPVLWTSLEYLKSHLLTGFPWEDLAYSQYLYRPIIQIADLTGIYGVTFLIVWVNVLFYEILSAHTGVRARRWRFIAGIVLITLVCGYGEMRIRQTEAKLRSAPTIAASVIQGNIDQGIKWNPRYQKSTLDIYSSLSERVPPSSPGLIVWPETAMPFYFQDRDERHRDILSLVKKSGQWLLFGGPGYRVQGDGSVAYANRAFLLSPAGQLAGRYDKVHLVPYGEYVPLRQFFPFIRKLTAGTGDFQPGSGFIPLPIDKSHQLGVLICYEGIFPEPARTYKAAGADLLVNITNDAWFGKTSAPYQHLSMTIFRSVENRVFLVRAANTGISAIVDPTGRIVHKTGLFAETSFSGVVKFLDEKTFYTVYGDIFVYTCLAFLVVLYLISLKRSNDLCMKESLPISKT